MNAHDAKYPIGQVVKHKLFPFRGVIFDVDPTFANSEEWYESIPAEIRPPKEQPFYHLLAENAESYYVAYVSEQNLEQDETGEPVGHRKSRPCLASCATAATRQATATGTRAGRRQPALSGGAACAYPGQQAAQLERAP